MQEEFTKVSGEKVSMDTMWRFLMMYGQKANIPALKQYVSDLIDMTTQKTAGQDGFNGKKRVINHISWDENLQMTMMSIVIEATALVLSGELDKIETGSLIS